MVKSNRAGKANESANNSANKKDAEIQASASSSQPADKTSTGNASKGKQSGKNQRTAIGGTAVQGAKSTQPKKDIAPGPQAQQQPEFYNRETRRRMQQMNTGPYSENKALDPRERRRKRQERQKERQAEIKQHVDAKGPNRDIRLGRRNTYFLIGVAVLIIALIVIALFVKHVL